MATTRFAHLPALALAAALAGISGLALAQSAPSADAPPPPLPPPSSLPPPSVATLPARPTADMQEVLDALAGLGGKPIETLTPVEARVQPSATDAVRVVMMRRGLSPMPDASVTTRQLPYGTDARQFARLYTPAAAPGGGRAMPVIIYYHGGGWVIANVDTYDATPRFLAKQLGAIVVSVEYRRAPEAKFPAQHEDAAAAYRWVLTNAASWGGDPARVALAGESAGGNLAIATAIYARDNGLPLPLHILSIYPIANSGSALPSRVDSRTAKPLDAAMLPWFSYYYRRTPADSQDPRINLVSADLRGLPATTIVNAQIDPLRSDGETLAQAMRAAGDQVEQRTFVGVTHEFFGMGNVVRSAAAAELYAADRLTAAFAAPAKPTR